MKTCILKNCGKVKRPGGMCAGHYSRYLVHGDPYEDVPLSVKGNQRLAHRRKRLKSPKNKSWCRVCNKYKLLEFFTKDVTKCKDCHADYKRKINYGMIPGQYKEMLKKQKNKCALCGTKKPGGTHNVFYVDHCHKTKKIRGLLCMKCNRNIIGVIEANKIDPKKIMEYLK